MKRRVLGLLLSLVLIFGLIGCGNNAETKQEESTGSSTELEETQEKEQNVTSQEFSNDDIIIKVEDTIPKYGVDAFEYEDAEGSITPESDVPIYCEDGYQIGYIKSGATIEITGHGVNSQWYRFPNPIDGTMYDYIYVGSMDTNMDDIYCESLVDNYVVPSESTQEEPIEEEQITHPYVEILTKVGYDTSKIYEKDEYIEIITKIFEEMGKTYNEELEQEELGQYDDYYIAEMYCEEFNSMCTYNLIRFMDYGQFYSGGVTEFWFEIGEKDGKEIIGVRQKADPNLDPDLKNVLNEQPFNNQN